MPVADPGDLFDAAPQPVTLSWVRHGAGLVAWGEAARATLPAGDDRFTAGEKWLRDVADGADVDDRVGRPGTGLVAFGSFTFDPASDGSVLVVPRTVLGRDRDGRAWLTVIGAGDGEAASDRHASDRPQQRRGPLHRGAMDHGAADHRAGNHDHVTAPSNRLRGEGSTLPWTVNGNPPGQRPEAGIRWHDGAMSAPGFERAVAVAVRAIRAGRLHKVVLARDRYATAAEPFDVRTVLRRLADRYPDCFTFACANLVGATPELLIRRDGDQISSLVLAGTAPRGADDTADAELAAGLLASAKDTEEHRYAVASVRDTLQPLCDRLDVAARPSLLELANVHHLGTAVHGRLAGERSALALAGLLHPTAAVGGTPTAAALEMIRELETFERGRYTGPVGWMDARGNGEWGIALRCAELDGRSARLFAGNGIVSGSEPRNELAETEAKFRPMRQALEG